MKHIVIEEKKDGTGWFAWVSKTGREHTFRLSDVCEGKTRAEAAGKVLLAYPEVVGIDVFTFYLPAPEEPVDRFVIQTRFMGSHGKMANQFFGGIGPASGYPIWVNLLSEAVCYMDAERAESVLKGLSALRLSHDYSVVALSAADETATRA